MNVLFVCSSNTCRSPMAEAVLDDIIDRSSDLRGNVKVESCGTFACEGQEASELALKAMEELGLSLKKHEAKQFDSEKAEWADLILAMSKEQIEHMEAIAPKQTSKMHTLLGYINGVYGDPVDDEYNVPDPFKGDEEDYIACAKVLKPAVAALSEIIFKELFYED